MTTTTTKKVLTEDLGKIFEMAICLYYDTSYDGNYKYSLEQAHSLKNRLNNLKNVFPYAIKHCASRGNTIPHGLGKVNGKSEKIRCSQLNSCNLHDCRASFF